MMKERVIAYKKVNRRSEKILTQMEMKDGQVKKLRTAKKQLFEKANPHEKGTLLRYEELESVERTIMARTIYLETVKDGSKKN